MVLKSYKLKDKPKKAMFKKKKNRRKR